jgi:hypothetical protein
MSEVIPTIESMIEYGDSDPMADLFHDLEVHSELDFWDPERDPPKRARSRLDSVPHGLAADELAGIARRRREIVADEYRLTAEILRDAEVDVDFWTGPDPTQDPDWMDPRGRSAASIRRTRRDLAVRAAAADIAVRLRISEAAVRTRATNADVLRQRMPRTWTLFLGGGVDEQNAVTAAMLAASLPADAAPAWREFDDRVIGIAGILTAARFRISARAARERAHPESLDARHARAAEDRTVWRTPELDGMATLTAYVPAAAAEEVFGHVDKRARHLSRQDDESRTLAQLRADVFVDLLMTGSAGAVASAPTVTGAPAARASVAVTIPVLTLLGVSEEPATLDGYGPIDLAKAKRLAGDATSWVRILTHPVSGTVLDVDRRAYRIPADLRRWLGVAQPTCAFPGCGRSSRDCDIDHRVDWQYGGTTSNDNLDPVCEHHHTLKHESRWESYRCPSTGATWWISPTAAESQADPPPF